MASYVTGSHNIKFGIENDWGPGPAAQEHAQWASAAALHQQSADPRSRSSTIRSSSLHTSRTTSASSLQDSWTIKRLTINPGLRVQWVETGMYESSMAAGRFAPARFIEEERGLIDFGADYSPRFSAVYDLFGDGRTALKGSWSKYYRNYDGDIAANAYGRAGERSEMRTWLDRNLVTGTNNPSGAAATVCVLAFASFRPIATASRRTTKSAPARAAERSRIPIGPIAEPLNLERQYNDEFTAGVQHQVSPRVAVGAMFYKRRIADLAFQDRTNIGLADYTRFETPMPDVSRDPDVAAVLKAGDMVPVYNLNPAKLSVFNVGVVDRSDTTNDTLYTGFEASFNARLPGGAMLFGSWTMEHTLQRWCDNDDNPNGPTTTGQFNPTAATTGVDAPLGGRYCDQTAVQLSVHPGVQACRQLHVPLRPGHGRGDAELRRPGAHHHVGAGSRRGSRTGSARRRETFILNAPGYDLLRSLESARPQPEEELPAQQQGVDVPDRHLQCAERQRDSRRQQHRWSRASATRRTSCSAASRGWRVNFKF